MNHGIAPEVPMDLDDLMKDLAYNGPFPDTIFDDTQDAQAPLEAPFFNMNFPNPLAGAAQPTDPVAALDASIDFDPAWLYTSNTTFDDAAFTANNQNTQTSFASGSGTYNGGRDTPYQLPFSSFTPSPVNNGGLLPDSLTPDMPFNVPSWLRAGRGPSHAPGPSPLSINHVMPSEHSPFFDAQPPSAFSQANEAGPAILPFNNSFSQAESLIPAPQPVRPAATPIVNSSNTPIARPNAPSSSLANALNYLPPYARPEELSNVSPHYRRDYEHSAGAPSSGYRSSYVPKQVDRSTARKKVKAARAEVVLGKEASTSGSASSTAHPSTYIPNFADLQPASVAVAVGNSQAVASGSNDAATASSSNNAASGGAVVGTSSSTAAVQRPIQTSSFQSRLPPSDLPSEFMDSHSGELIHRFENGAIFRASSRAIPDAPRDTRAPQTAIVETDVVDRQYAMVYSAETRRTMPLRPRVKVNLILDRRMVMELDLDQYRVQLTEWFGRYPGAAGPPRGKSSYSHAAFKNLFASRALLFDVLDRWEQGDGVLTFPKDGWAFRDDSGYRIDKRFIGTRQKKARN